MAPEVEGSWPNIVAAKNLSRLLTFPPTRVGNVLLRDLRVAVISRRASPTHLLYTPRPNPRE